MQQKPPGAAKREPKVVIIGAGMSGLLAAVKLHEAGIRDVVLYEKSDAVGGTWRDNRYPGLSCDVPAHLYTYSFEPNPDYSRRFAHGAEIRAYFERVARKYNLESIIKFNCELTDAAYRNSQWHLKTRAGDEVVADIVISASGVLHHPQYPDIDGLEDFEGPLFHSARWDDEARLENRRVAVIGTGSTAVQMTPHLQRVAKKYLLFQRTPQWVYPLFDREYSDRVKQRVAKRPWLLGLVRGLYSKVFFDWFFARAVIGNKWLLGLTQWVCRRHLESKVADPKLRERLRPNYQAGCKRLIFASGFYEALQKDNAALITEGIERIEPRGIRTVDGQLHEVDAIILATGFKPHNFMRPMSMVGEGGKTIEQAWQAGAQAYRSIAIPGFPNFFMLIGPNSPIGNYSLISISEIQMDYIAQLIELWRDGKAQEIAPTAAASEQFNQAVKKAMKGTVWSSGCQSWYLDNNGNPAMWPWSFERFREEMSRPDLSEFVLKTPNPELLSA